MRVLRSREGPHRLFEYPEYTSTALVKAVRVPVLVREALACTTYHTAARNSTAVPIMLYDTRSAAVIS